MSKITETMMEIRSGARTNKYRVLYPFFGQDMDIVCNATTMPGRELGTTEVFVKGRKYTLAAEMADDTTWEMTFYNTPNLYHRRFFLQMLYSVHNFNTPVYLLDGGSASASELTRVSPVTSQEASRGGTSSMYAADNPFGGVKDWLDNFASAATSVKRAYNDVRETFDLFTNQRNLKRVLNEDWNDFSSFMGPGSYFSRPWYQHDITVEQMDHNDEPIIGMTLFNAFPTTVSPIEWSDEVGDISTTTVTFAFSDVAVLE